MQNKYEKLATDIYKFCKRKDLWYDIIIYFNGKAWSTFPTWGKETGKRLDEDVYEYENKNPLDYFEYANPETLSMSTEGSLYYVLNGYTPGWVKLEMEFSDLFTKYDLYYEMGHAWNLSTYEI